MGVIKGLRRLVVACIKQLSFGFEGLECVSSLQSVPLNPIGKKHSGLVAVLHASHGLSGKQLRLVAAVLAALGKVFALFAQFVLKALVHVGAKDLAEDGRAFLGAFGEELFKIALRKHHNLAELVGIDAEQLNYLFGDALTAQLRAIGHFKRAFAQANRGTLATLFRSRIPTGIALDAIAFAAQLEGEVNVGRHVGTCVIATQVLGFAKLAGALAEQGEGDRIENGGLTCACFAGEQVDAFGSQQREVNLCHAGKRSKGAHPESCGPHLQHLRFLEGVEHNLAVFFI